MRLMHTLPSRTHEHAATAKHGSSASPDAAHMRAAETRRVHASFCQAYVFVDICLRRRQCRTLADLQTLLKHVAERCTVEKMHYSLVVDSCFLALLVGLHGDKSGQGVLWAFSEEGTLWKALRFLNIGRSVSGRPHPHRSPLLHGACLRCRLPSAAQCRQLLSPVAGLMPRQVLVDLLETIGLLVPCPFGTEEEYLQAMHSESRQRAHATHVAQRHSPWGSTQQCPRTLADFISIRHRSPCVRACVRAPLRISVRSSCLLPCAPPLRYTRRRPPPIPSLFTFPATWGPCMRPVF